MREIGCNWANFNSFLAHTICRMIIAGKSNGNDAKMISKV